MRRVLLLAGLPALGVVVADQAVKLWIEHAFALGEFKPLCSWLNIAYVRNQGAAWGMFQGAQLWLALFGVVAVVLCILFWKHLFGTGRLALLLGGMLTGGIVGNIIDRFRLGYVVDFIDVHWAQAHFPCFNVADSAICVAVFLLVLLQWKKPA